MAVFRELILLRDLGPALERIGRWFPEMVVGALQRTALESKTILALTTRATEPYAPIDTGTYMRSWTRVNFPDGADIVNDARQASPMEIGTRPYWISEEGRQRIAEWALRKSRFSVRGRKKKAPRVGRKKKARSVRQRMIGPRNINFSKTAFGGAIQRANQRGGYPAALAAAERLAWAIAWKYSIEGQQPGREVLGRAWPKIVRLAGLNIDEALMAAAATTYGRGGAPGGARPWRPSKGRQFGPRSTGARLRRGL